MWGLSLLVVRPDAQSSGAGRELLDRAYEYGDGARGRVVLASPDARALRSYARLRARAAPGDAGAGRPRNAAMPPERPARDARRDLPLTVAVDRAVRGAAHGDDIARHARGRRRAARARRARLRGRARRATVRLLAATDEAAAATLLRGCLAAAGAREASVEWITSAQGWAVAPCLDAGLELRMDGAVFLAGDVGPFAPYLPSGAYL